MMKLFLFISLSFSNFIVAQNNAPQRTINDYRLAEDYYREGAFEKATQLFQKLYESNTFNTNYLGRLISCYQETSKFMMVEKLLVNNLKQNKNHAHFYVYLGYNYQKQLQLDKANENYALAINALEKNASYGGLIGQLFREYNLLDLAILAYEKTMLLNKNTNYNLQIAQIFGEKGDYQKMFEAYIDLVDKNEKYLNIVQRYSGKYISKDPENETNILFKKALLKKSASQPKAIWNVLLSWFFAQQKEYTKALIQEKALFSRGSNNLDAFFILGKIAFDNTSYSASKKCFNFIIEKSLNKNERIQAHFYLAKIAVDTKDPTTAVFFQSLFNIFGKSSATIQLQVAYADYLTFQKNKPNIARAILEEALSYATSKFEEARIKLKLGDVLVFTGEFNKALLYFSQIQIQLTDHVLAQEARFKAAQTSYFKGDFDWAKAQLKVLKGAATQLIANDAAALYLKILDNEPIDSIPSGLTEFAHAELLEFQNKNKEALTSLENLFTRKDIFPNGLIPSEVIYSDVLFLQAKLLLKQKKHEEAIAALSHIIRGDSQFFLADTIYFMIAETYYNDLKKTSKAQEYYQKIIFEYPGSIYVIDAREKYRSVRGDKL
ncbi:tetratricopeptide repeat domain protein [Polaribacter irgensii 23-P]|uniref:Tetratricopeptide repeat domain protein n=1 Tax=Polaribacter irgensii 23-P TaxID=313594 RepID=A4BXE7_9FLAO|nr:tetratricopeptide repeat protein [Polaribacter irgensii]EAR13638.1 tetratricopeptide repeat domain protein [Polaribacter irgensii 23-P]